MTAPGPRPRRPYRTEPDGTRVYDNGMRYKPVADADRKYKRHKPDDPRAVRFRDQWFLPLELLDDAARAWPETVPDEVTLEHRARCTCRVCRRPQAAVLWRRRRAREARGARP